MQTEFTGDSRIFARLEMRRSISFEIATANNNVIWGKEKNFLRESSKVYFLNDIYYRDSTIIIPIFSRQIYIKILN